MAEVEEKPRRRRRLGLTFWLSVVWLIIVGLGALTADFLPIADPANADFLSVAQPIGAQGEQLMQHTGEYEEHTYWLGSDNIGRDVFARLLKGAQASLLIGLLSPLIGLIVGGSLGLIAGFYRGWSEAIVVAGIDIVLAFPALVLLTAVIFYAGATTTNVILSLGFLSVPAFTRVARATTLAFAQREFVLAARASGASDFRILTRELLPNVLVPMLVYGLLVTAVLIVVEGVLSFLGLGVQPPAMSWGTLIESGRDFLEDAPHITFIPAAVMCLTVLSFNLIGDQLRNLGDTRESRL
ncbi:ABC transporter permease [Minwuia sp.]|uniref:ABC transporter permease n=1 Tax=Minwuia sp. TaxID=2493630 RepID=UPI003A8E16F4